MRGIPLDKVLCSSLLYGYLKMGRFDETEDILQRIFDHQAVNPIVVYTELIDGYCKAGMMENAESMMPEMLNRGIPANVVAFSSLIPRVMSLRERISGDDNLDALIGLQLSKILLTYSPFVGG